MKASGSGVVSFWLTLALAIGATATSAAALGYELAGSFTAIANAIGVN